MSTTWSDSKTVHHHPPVDIRFGLPKYMEKCLNISIAAGNGAGMSSPTIFTGELITTFPWSATKATNFVQASIQRRHCVLIMAVSLSWCVELLMVGSLPYKVGVVLMLENCSSLLPSCQEWKHFHIHLDMLTCLYVYRRFPIQSWILARTCIYTAQIYICANT